MESCIAQSIHKGFEKENWKARTRACATSEDMLWKLDALQCFIRDLHWVRRSSLNSSFEFVRF